MADYPQAGSLAPLTARRMERWVLVAILLLSTGANLINLHRMGTNGVGNAYYAAGVKSMQSSLHNFFYLSFDPAGFLALDKAPLALWAQTLLVKVFGFHGWCLLLPQALAGILSVWVLYRLVGRTFGHRAGLLAALALAIMPVSVVTARNNTPDSLMILALLLAAWALLRAVEEKRLRWLLISAVLVGVAFNIKMLQLVLVLPGLALVYLVGWRVSWLSRIRYGLLAGLVAVLVTAPWVLAVELTPADQRPYVGGSESNSVLELVLGYNGIERMWGEDWSFFLGTPSPLRFFTDKLAGQISWLLPFGMVGLAAAFRQNRGAEDYERRRNNLILWTGWLVVPLIYFSISSFYHRYYLATMAPAVAAVFGIAVVSLWPNGRARWWWLALLGTAGLQVVFLLPFPDWSRWLIPVIVGLVAVSIVLVRVSRRLRIMGFTAGIAALFVAPAVWSAIPVFDCVHMVMPVAGPQAESCRGYVERPFLDLDLVEYLESNREGAQFLAATYDLGIAEMGILETGEPFLALGGYRGSDPILTLDQFVERVTDGQVRFFLTLLMVDKETYPQQAAIHDWVDDHCSLAPIEVPYIEVRGPCVVEIDQEQG